jgi:hypothetical protein
MERPENIYKINDINLSVYLPKAGQMLFLSTWLALNANFRFSFKFSSSKISLGLGEYP